MTNYDELAAQAAAGQLAPKQGSVQRGSAAADSGRRLLMDATGAETVDEAVKIARGRRRLDAPAPDEVTWRVRTTGALDREVRHLADVRGQTISQVVRDAVANYVRAAGQ